MGKFDCFQHVLCHNSAIFEDIDLKFCTHIHQPLPSNMFYVFFENFVFKGKMFRKYKILSFFIFFLGNFKSLKNTRKQFCSPTNSTSYTIRQFIVA